MQLALMRSLQPLVFALPSLFLFHFLFDRLSVSTRFHSFPVPSITVSRGCLPPSTCGCSERPLGVQGSTSGGIQSSFFPPFLLITTLSFVPSPSSLTQKSFHPIRNVSSRETRWQDPVSPFCTALAVSSRAHGYSDRSFVASYPSASVPFPIHWRLHDPPRSSLMRARGRSATLETGGGTRQRPLFFLLINVAGVGAGCVAL